MSVVSMYVRANILSRRIAESGDNMRERESASVHTVNPMGPRVVSHESAATLVSRHRFVCVVGA